MALLEVKDLSVWYGAAQALDQVSFRVDEGEVVAIIGNNGAGKSTILKTVSGVSELGKTVEGEIVYRKRRIERMTSHRLAQGAMAHVPEGRRVFSQLTVEENLLLGAYRRRSERDSFPTDLADVYDRFPSLDRARHKMAGLLSGGEQQMLAMGRALMAKPRLLLMDEPSLGLAPLLVAEVFEIIRQLAAENTTILIVEQLAHLALDVADRAYVLETGRITAEGAASAIAADPRVQAAYLGS